MVGRLVPEKGRFHDRLRGARVFAVIAAVALVLAATAVSFGLSQGGRALADDAGAPAVESTLSAEENPSDVSTPVETTPPSEEPAPMAADEPEGDAEAQGDGQEAAAEGTSAADPASGEPEPPDAEDEGTSDQPGDGPDTSDPASDPDLATDPAAADPTADPSANPDPAAPTEDPATSTADQPAAADQPAPTDPETPADPAAETPADDPYAPYAPEDLLFSEAVQTDAPDLDGASVAIVNRLTGLSLTATSASVNGVDALAGRDVSVTEVEGLPRIVNDDAVFWTFSRAAEGGNSYYISTEVDGATRYLYLGAQPYNSSNDGRG